MQCFFIKAMPGSKKTPFAHSGCVDVESVRASSRVTGIDAIRLSDWLGVA